MKRCAKPFICRRMTALASGATGERSPVRLMPQRSSRGRGDALAGEVLAQVAGDLAAAAQRGEDVDEAQHLHLEALVRHRPLHHLALQALAESSRASPRGWRRRSPGGGLDALLVLGTVLIGGLHFLRGRRAADRRCEPGSP